MTTVVDAGSSGWRNFGEFRDQIINRSQTRVLAMLNIVGSGMGGRPDVERSGVGEYGLEIVAMHRLVRREVMDPTGLK